MSLQDLFKEFRLFRLAIQPSYPLLMAAVLQTLASLMRYTSITYDNRLFVYISSCMCMHVARVCAIRRYESLQREKYGEVS